MSEHPTAGRSAYWAAYRELAKKGSSSWRKVWVGTQASFFVAFAIHYFWLRQKVGALANLEVHVLYVVLPSLLGLGWLFVVSLFRAPFRMAKTIEADRDHLTVTADTISRMWLTQRASRWRRVDLRTRRRCHACSRKSRV